MYIVSTILLATWTYNKAAIADTLMLLLTIVYFNTITLMFLYLHAFKLIDPKWHGYYV